MYLTENMCQLFESMTEEDMNIFYEALQDSFRDMK